MPNSKTLIAALVLVPVTAVGAWVALQGSGLALFERGKHMPTSANKAQADKPAPRPVRVVRPEPVPGTTTLTLSGRTAPAEQAYVSSRASGVVSERRVDIGDRVGAGDVLVVIEAPDVAQQLIRARASVDQIKARLDFARVSFERAEKLVRQGHVSEQAFDDRRSAKMTAEADLAAALAEVKRLEEVVSFQTIRAPFAGTVVARQVERGDKVTAEQSQPSQYLLRVARLDPLRIEVDVPQSWSLAVKPGAQAKVVFAELPGETLAASVVRSSGMIEQASSTMRAELSMPNPEGRIPAGLNGQVAIEVAQGTAVVSVPTNTLMTRDGRQVVATVTLEDKVALKPVTVARDLGERVVIAGGLTPNDRVISSPNALLRPGDPVEVITPTARANGAR